MAEFEPRRRTLQTTPARTPARGWPTRGPALLGAALLLAYLAALLATPVRDVDEAIYAEIAREMLARGSWVEPRLNDGAWYQHPPLVMWAQAASLGALGPHAAAARLPSLLAVLGVAGLLWAWQRRRGVRAPWQAALLWLSLPATHLMVRDAKLDAVLTLCLTGALLAGGLRAISWRVALGALAVAAGVLTKNAVGALWPLAVLGAAWALERRGRVTTGALPVPGWAGMAALAGSALALPWFVEMHHRYGPHFVDTILGRQLWSRFAGAALTDATGPLFFVAVLAWAAAPFWLVGGGAALRALVRLWRRQDPGLGPRAALAVAGALLPLLVLSASRSKLPHYIFPVLPWLIVLALAELARLEAAPASRWGRVVGATLALTPGGALALLAGHAALSFDPTPAGWALLGTLLVVTLATPAPWRRLAPAAALWPAMLALCLVHLYTSLSVDQRRRAYEPAPAIAATLAVHDPGGREPLLAFAFNMRSAIAFAAQRPVQEVDAASLRRHLAASPGPRWLLVLDDARATLRAAGVHLDEVARFAWHRTSRPSLDFALRWRRAGAVQALVLARARLAPDPPPGDDGPRP